jgi:membrane-associated phospholipid phosphatase
MCNGTAVPFFDVTIDHDVTVLLVLCIVYSFMPYLVAVYFLVRDVMRSLFYIFASILGIFIVLINEEIVKRIVESPRPLASCLKSFGMPSGHSAISIGVLVWMLLELITDTKKSVRRRILLGSLYCLIAVPIPPSRVCIGDHSPLQVGIGSAEGFVMGTLYFIFMLTVVRPRLDRLLQLRFIKLLRLKNDYYLTRAASGELEPGEDSNKSLPEINAHSSLIIHKNTD